MSLIFESKNYIVQSAEFPLVDRNDGGHITIDPKFKISTRQELSPAQAIELMRLTIVAGAAMNSVLKRNGVDIGRINYQDNGNWSVFNPEGPQLHYHLYGRAKSAIIQKYGQTLHLPHKDEDPDYYKSLKPLTTADVSEIKNEMASIFKKEEYSDAQWKLNKPDSMTRQVSFFAEKLEFEIDPSDLFAALNNEERIIVIDSRQAKAYQQEHIPGAIHLHYSEMDNNHTKHFDKEAIYAVYCDGIGCNASTKGALNLSRLGFKVKEVIGGLQKWKIDGFTTEGKLGMAGQNISCAC
jgi:rhodanese-related sulfurtransferase